jgi:hypothetical protein
MAPAVLSLLAYQRQLPTGVHQELVALDERFATFQTKGKQGQLAAEREEEDRDWQAADRGDPSDRYPLLSTN